jgi:hypothetical protein
MKSPTSQHQKRTALSDLKVQPFSFQVQFIGTQLSRQTQRLLSLIPIISRAARSFSKEHELEATAVTHADNLSAWLYGVKTGLVPETRYSVNPNNTKIATFCSNRHLQCITLSIMAATSTRARGVVVIDNASVISQLTNAISLQNKEAMESNNLCRKEIEQQIKREEKKKDRTKKLHPAIVNMLK